MVKCLWAPACEVALDEATALWPNRRKTSDGVCASATHTAQNPGSDHEPHVVINGHGYATAFDLSDDKAAGCDADWLVEQLRLAQDPRIKYVIAERRMYSSYPSGGYMAWEWRPYNGSNPHSSHIHVSVLRHMVFDTTPWWGPLLEGADPMAGWSEEDSKNLAELNESMKAINHAINGKDSRMARLVRAAEDLKKVFVK